MIRGGVPRNGRLATKPVGAAMERRTMLPSCVRRVGLRFGRHLHHQLFSVPNERDTVLADVAKIVSESL